MVIALLELICVESSTKVIETLRGLEDVDVLVIHSDLGVEYVIIPSDDDEDPTEAELDGGTVALQM